jgi:hypothetical protein
MIKKLIYTLIILLINLLLLIIIFFIGEVSLRYYYYYKYNINIFNGANESFIDKDDKRGWKIAKNLKYDIKAKDSTKNIYDVHVETDEYGFRSFGNLQSNKLKIFFIGDSFTETIDVSNDKTFHGIIKNTIKDVDVFAYGVSGYGSLQEFMVLDEWIDIIKPNLIIWQFYKNDFQENDYNMDIQKTLYNTGIPRPYLDLDGKITYQYPKYDNFFCVLPEPVAENIRLLKILNEYLGRIINIIYKEKTVYDENAQLPNSNAQWQHSAQITKMIMQMVKRRAGTIPIYLFCIDKKQPYYDIIKDICQSVGISFIDSIPQNLDQFEKEHPYITKAADKEHLNETGNRIIAEGLLQFLKENKVIP